MSIAMSITKDFSRESLELREEDEQLRVQISELTIPQKRHYYALAAEKVKNPDTYAALNWIFLVGLHHFYLGKWQRGCINLTLILLGISLFFSNTLPVLGIIFIALSTFIELPQLFNSQKIIYSYNIQLMKTLLKQVAD